MSEPRAFCVVGLGYGDEGKGQVVDHLTREKGATVVMRFSGGAQAAHNVIAPDGRHHTFAQFGSGTFVPGVKTYLGAGMMVNPLDMFNEYYHLASLGEGDVWDRLSVNKNALVTTPIHAAANRLRESMRGDGAHGTTGKGIGETKWALKAFSEGLRVRDLGHPAATRNSLVRLINNYSRVFEALLDEILLETDDSDLLAGRRPDLVEWMVDRYHEWSERTNIVDNYHLKEVVDEDLVILEGSQGILLDERRGFHPHTTWADLTPAAARAELRVAGVDSDEIHTVGVTRTYSTRHGAGPFPPHSRATSDAGYEFFKKHPIEPHNGDRGHPGKFFVGPFDAIAFSYAVNCTSPDSIAVTHMDRFEDLVIPATGSCMTKRDSWPVVEEYEYQGPDGAAPYLTLDGKGKVTGIVGSNNSEENYHLGLAWMECLGRRLKGCAGHTVDLHPDQIIPTIESLAGVRVSIVGSGPNNYRSVK